MNVVTDFVRKDRFRDTSANFDGVPGKNTTGRNRRVSFDFDAFGTNRVGELVYVLGCSL